MQLPVSDKDLKSQSLSFRTVYSRVLTSNYRDAISNLKRLLAFIDGSPLLNDFVQGHQTRTFDIRTIVLERGYYERFPIPTDADGEIAFTYQLLQYMIGRSSDPLDIWRYVQGYNGAGNVQADFEGFAHDVVRPFVGHLTTYLEALMDETRKSDNRSTTVNIGSVQQFNLAQDGSTINAVNQPGVNSVHEVGERLLQTLSKVELPESTKNDLKDATEAALEETKSDRPKQSVLKLCARTISSLASNLPEVAKTAQEFVNLLHQWVPSNKS